MKADVVCGVSSEGRSRILESWSLHTRGRDEDIHLKVQVPQECPWPKDGPSLNSSGSHLQWRRASGLFSQHTVPGKSIGMSSGPGA